MGPHWPGWWQTPRDRPLPSSSPPPGSTPRCWCPTHRSRTGSWSSSQSGHNRLWKDYSKFILNLFLITPHREQTPCCPGWPPSPPPPWPAAPPHRSSGAPPAASSLCCSGGCRGLWCRPWPGTPFNTISYLLFYIWQYPWPECCPHWHRMCRRGCAGDCWGQAVCPPAPWRCTWSRCSGWRSCGPRWSEHSHQLISRRRN